MTIPRDLLHEVHSELEQSCRSLTREAERLAQLIELERHASCVSLRLGRTLTVVDLFEELGDEPTDRMAALLHSLRGDERA